MINSEKFENEKYQQEKNDFLSDKCGRCMNYVNHKTQECENTYCEAS